MILAGASIAFVAGVWLGSLFGPPGLIPLVLSALLVLLAWLARRYRSWPVLLLAAALCLGFWRSLSLYHYLLTISWPKFLAYVTAAYIGANAPVL